MLRLRPLLLAALALVAVPAAARTVRCVVKTDTGTYRGPCDFLAERGGSFSIQPLKQGEFFKHDPDEPGIASVSVTVVGAEGDVRGLTTAGVNSRWGSARRSKADRACWVGADFTVCAY
jgi:hypothetical protein